MNGTSVQAPARRAADFFTLCILEKINVRCSSNAWSEQY
jgi:hypothetical protein